DRQPEGRGDARAPLGDLAAALADDPAADVDDEADLLGQRDERRRHEQAALRVGPADERLDGDRAARRDLDDRLVGDLELVPGERLAEIRFELQAVLHEGPGPGLVAAGAALA